MSAVDYRQAGVDIDAGNEAVRRIKAPGPADLHARRARRRWVVRRSVRVSTGRRRPRARGQRRRRGHQAQGGLHGGHARHDRRGSRQPLRERHPGAGRAAAVLPRLPRHWPALAPDVVEQIVAGVARACVENGCALLGGETAEMPGFYSTANTMWLDSSSASSHGRLSSTVAASSPVTGLSRCLRPGCTPTGTRSRAASPSRQLGLDVDSHVPELGTTRGRRASPAASVVPPSDRTAARDGLDQGHGSHHRWRHRGESPPRAARGTGLLHSMRKAGPCLRSSPGSRGRVACPTPEMFRAFNMGVGMILVCGRTDADASWWTTCAAPARTAWCVGQVVPADALVTRRWVSGRSDGPARPATAARGAKREGPASEVESLWALHHGQS